jgi:hypothetical protein
MTIIRHDILDQKGAGGIGLDTPAAVKFHGNAAYGLVSYAVDNDPLQLIQGTGKTGRTRIAGAGIVAASRQEHNRKQKDSGNSYKFKLHKASSVFIVHPTLLQNISAILSKFLKNTSFNANNPKKNASGAGFFFYYLNNISNNVWISASLPGPYRVHSVATSMLFQTDMFLFPCQRAISAFHRCDIHMEGQIANTKYNLCIRYILHF